MKNFFRAKKGQTFLKLFIRIFVWGGMSIIAIYPQITDDVAKIIGMQGNINAVILTGFLLIFLIIFKLLSAIEKIEQQISEVTRKETLKDLSNLINKK